MYCVYDVQCCLYCNSCNIVREAKMSEPGVRFAWKVSSFIPTKDQWIKALRCIQREERERITKFHYQIDAISSIVEYCFTCDTIVI